MERIQPTGVPHQYIVTLREPLGEAKSAVFTVWLDDISGATTDWDIFWRWPGDAQSVRSVVGQVCDFARSRLREFVGFVWQDDVSDRTGVLVEAADSSEASAAVKAAFGPGFGVSIWNEEDAARLR